VINFNLLSLQFLWTVNGLGLNPKSSIISIKRPYTQQLPKSVLNDFQPQPKTSNKGGSPAVARLSTAPRQPPQRPPPPPPPPTTEEAKKKTTQSHRILSTPLHSVNGAAVVMSSSSTAVVDATPAPSPSPSLTEEIERRYEIGRLLGSGGFSEVRLGVDRQTKERVAIKVPPLDFNPYHPTSHITTHHSTHSHSLLPLVLLVCTSSFIICTQAIDLPLFGFVLMHRSLTSVLWTPSIKPL
jgi:hypothetical protein